MPRRVNLHTLRSARTATKLVLLGLVLLVTGAGAVTAALAAQGGIATPTINSYPANPSTATSATFAFTDSTSGVSFDCSLDAAAFAACTSPKSYPGPLAQGSHTFSVRARNSKGQLSSTASYSWTITVTPPTLISTPATPTTATAATFSFSDSQSGVSFQCSLDGAAYATCTSPESYPGPLSEAVHTFNVRARNSVGYLSSATGYTWTVDRTPPPAPTLTGKPADPTTQQSASFSFTDAESPVGYLCQRDGSAFTACASAISYSALAEGVHGFAVKAVDVAGNVSAATSYSWTIDLTAPPVPTITSAPDASPTDTSATFAFADTESGVTYLCRLDGGALSACTSPTTYSGLSTASHTFQVQAVDRAGNASSPASYTWSIATAVSGFTLSGNVTQLLYPGAAAPLNVNITNPYNFDLLVSQLTVTVQRGTTKSGQPNPGCDGTVNLLVTRQYSGSAQLKVKSSRTVSLADLGVAQSQWPQLLMPDLSTNQDACKGATYTFKYSATATKATP